MRKDNKKFPMLLTKVKSHYAQENSVEALTLDITEI
jgi:hypothetical protein